MPLRRGSGKVLPRQRYRNALLHKMIFIPSLAERQRRGNSFYAMRWSSTVAANGRAQVRRSWSIAGVLRTAAGYHPFEAAHSDEELAREAGAL
jgi:hypothetical protein